MDNHNDHLTKLNRIAGVSNQHGPGSDSNYLNWEFKVELALENLRISSVLTPTLPKDQPLTWARDNTRFCALISWAVDDVNIKYIKPLKRDAASMWACLKQSHKDSTTEGQLHLLQQLITMRMEMDNV